jgi:hypothetical protein
MKRLMTFIFGLSFALGRSFIPFADDSSKAPAKATPNPAHAPPPPHKKKKGPNPNSKVKPAPKDEPRKKAT